MRNWKPQMSENLFKERRKGSNQKPKLNLSILLNRQRGLEVTDHGVSESQTRPNRFSMHSFESPYIKPIWCMNPQNIMLREGNHIQNIAHCQYHIIPFLWSSKTGGTNQWWQKSKLLFLWGRALSGQGDKRNQQTNKTTLFHCLYTQTTRIQTEQKSTFAFKNKHIFICLSKERLYANNENMKCSWNKNLNLGNADCENSVL